MGLVVLVVWPALCESYSLVSGVSLKLVVGGMGAFRLSEHEQKDAAQHRTMTLISAVYPLPASMAYIPLPLYRFRWRVYGIAVQLGLRVFLVPQD